MLELRLAWRNVWRNPRRTGLTVAATVFAVVLVIVSVAMSEGSWEQMIDDAVRLNAGHVQISGEGYLQKKSLEQFVRLQDDQLSRIAATPGVVGVAPRVVSFGLLSQGPATRGVQVVGVDPRREGQVSTLLERVREGRFAAPGPEREIVLGTRLAKVLGASLGDEVLLYSLAYSLETAYEIFRVVGVMRLPEAEMDRSVAFVSLEAAQAFYVYGDRLSEIAILANDSEQVPAIAASLEQELTGQGVEVRTWRETMPELEQMVALDRGGLYVTLAILVMVVAFGILNTILMAVLERQKEFGVVLALGARPLSIFRIVYLESLLLAAVGLAAGLAVALPLVLHLQANPIVLTGEMSQVTELIGVDPVVSWRLRANNPIASVLTILVVAVVAALYPALKASRGRPVEALRSL